MGVNFRLFIKGFLNSNNKTQVGEADNELRVPAALVSNGIPLFEMSKRFLMAEGLKFVAQMPGFVS